MDRCVKCALCAPVCPTYQLSHEESESPRGRIAIAHALAHAHIPLTDVARLHLDHCLSCRACEAVCPAEVKYGDLIDNTQQLLQQRAPRKQAFAGLISNKHYNRWLHGLLACYQRSGMQRLLRYCNFFNNTRWQRYDACLPTISPTVRWRSFYPAIGQELGQVGLLLGCAGTLLDQATLLAAIKVLTQVGYSVQVPRQQGCCGALDLHAGMQKNYQRHTRKNQQAFANLPIKALLGVASGCTAVLAESKIVAVPIRDINEFLANEAWNDVATLQPYPHEVLLHTPCTLKNVLKSAAAPQHLLARIPNIKLQLLPDTVGCCGAAGSYFLRFPELAEQLVAKTLALIPTSPVPLIVTSNIGCQLQLSAGMQLKKQSPTRVIHLVSLLAQQMTLKTAN